MSEAVKVDPQTSPGLEGLVPIDLEILQEGEPLEFPIYQRLNGSRSFSLVMNRRQRFTERLRAAIRTSEGLKVYTERRFLSDYEDYLESRLGNFLSDESVPLEIRSGVLYGQTSKVVEGLFTGDISPKSLEKAANEASHLSMYLSLNPKALRSIMSLISNDYFTFTHSLHVCIYGLGLYQQVFPAKSAVSVGLVSVGLLFHDIGKSRVEGAILKKEGPLNPSEWKTVKLHPAWGRDILVENGIQDPTVLDIALAHHERMDGQGYPNGLTGDELTDVAKIAAIADAFDAMTTNRPYKKRLTRFEALKVMNEQNQYGDYFAHHFFEAFVRMMGD